MKGFGAEQQMRPLFFDVLHADGRDLVDERLVERSLVLGTAVIPGARRRRANLGR